MKMFLIKDPKSFHQIHYDKLFYVDEDAGTQELVEVSEVCYTDNDDQYWIQVATEKGQFWTGQVLAVQDS